MSTSPVRIGDDLDGVSQQLEYPLDREVLSYGITKELPKLILIPDNEETADIDLRLDQYESVTVFNFTRHGSIPYSKARGKLLSSMVYRRDPCRQGLNYLCPQLRNSDTHQLDDYMDDYIDDIARIFRDVVLSGMADTMFGQHCSLENGSTLTTECDSCLIESADIISEAYYDSRLAIMVNDYRRISPSHVYGEPEELDLVYIVFSIFAMKPTEELGILGK